MGHNYCGKRPVLSYVLGMYNKVKKYRKYKRKNITWFSNTDCLQNYGEKNLKGMNNLNFEDPEIFN